MTWCASIASSVPRSTSRHVLEELGIAVTKTHDLDKLLTILQPHHPKLRSLKRGLLILTDFAVDTRYPGNGTTKR
jgi:HEPN domain